MAATFVSLDGVNQFLPHRVRLSDNVEYAACVGWLDGDEAKGHFQRLQVMTGIAQGTTTWAMRFYFDDPDTALIFKLRFG